MSWKIWDLGADEFSPLAKVTTLGSSTMLKNGTVEFQLMDVGAVDKKDPINFTGPCFTTFDKIMNILLSLDEKFKSPVPSLKTIQRIYGVPIFLRDDGTPECDCKVYVTVDVH
jgi:hypothetical protein